MSKVAMSETRESTPVTRHEAGPSSTLATLSAEVSQVRDLFRAAYAAFERTSRFVVLAKYGQAQAMTDAHDIEVFMEQIRRAQQPKRRIARIMRLFQKRDTLTHNLLVDFCLETLPPEDIAALEQQLQQTGNSFAQLEEHAMRTMSDALSETRQQASAIAEKIRAEMESTRLQITTLAHKHPRTHTETANQIDAQLTPFRSLLTALEQTTLLPTEPPKPLHRIHRNGSSHSHKNGHGAQRTNLASPTPKGA